MSARAPFVPRPASRTDASNGEQAQRLPSPPAAYEPFRSNGLLSAPDGPGEHPSKHSDMPPHPHPSSAKFKPLNLSGLGKHKNNAQSRPTLPRPSVDGSGSQPSRSPKPFASGQQKHLAATRPSSPFFPSPGLVSMNAFRAPPPPSRSHHSPESEEFSANKAHIVPHPNSLALGDLKDNTSSAHETDSFRFLDPSRSAHRSRTASHPSLASIHEVDEEIENATSRNTQPMAPPPAPALVTFAADYHREDFLGSSQQGEPLGQSLRRPMKRSEPAMEDGEEYEYGNDAKRYKMGIHEEYPSVYGGRATPGHYPSPALAGRVLEMSLLSAPGPSKANGDGASKQALYRLLGQDLDIWVEAHADSYEQARKRWSECSMEEWSKGADDLAERFSKLLDFVKEHMTAKLAVYASLQNAISQHKGLLAEKEKALTEARQSLVREGGAVVGETLSASTLAVVNPDKGVSG